MCAPGAPDADIDPSAKTSELRFIDAEEIMHHVAGYRRCCELDDAAADGYKTSKFRSFAIVIRKLHAWKLALGYVRGLSDS